MGSKEEVTEFQREENKYTMFHKGPRVCHFNNQFLIFFPLFDNCETFHGQAFRTLYGDPNLGVLAASQQLEPGKFRGSSMVEFKLRTMCHLLGPHFLVFALTNWATLAGLSFLNFSFSK